MQYRKKTPRQVSTENVATTLHAHLAPRHGQGKRSIEMPDSVYSVTDTCGMHLTRLVIMEARFVVELVAQMLEFLCSVEAVVYSTVGFVVPHFLRK